MAYDFVPSPNREGHAVAGMVGVCVKDAVGGGVVASGIHGVAAGFVERCLVCSQYRLIQHRVFQIRTGNRTSRVLIDVIVTVFAVSPFNDMLAASRFIVQTRWNVR